MTSTRANFENPYRMSLSYFNSLICLKEKLAKSLFKNRFLFKCLTGLHSMLNRFLLKIAYNISLSLSLSFYIYIYIYSSFSVSSLSSVSLSLSTLPSLLSPARISSLSSSHLLCSPSLLLPSSLLSFHHPAPTASSSLPSPSLSPHFPHFSHFQHTPGHSCPLSHRSLRLCEFLAAVRLAVIQLAASAASPRAKNHRKNISTKT